MKESDQNKKSLRIILSTILSLTLLCVIFIIIAGFGSYKNKSVATKTITILEKTLGAKCLAETISIRPWFGLKIDSLSIQRINSDGAMEQINCSQVDISYRFLNLLFNFNRIFKDKDLESRKSDLIGSPLISTDQNNILRIRDKIVKSYLSTIIEKIKIKNGNFTSSFIPEIEVSGNGLDGKILVNKNDIQGTLSFSELKIAQWRTEKCSFNFLVEKDILKIDKFKAFAYEGKVKASARIDLVKNSLLSSAIEASKIDVSQIYNSFESPEGKLTGTASVVCKLSAPMLVIDSLKGEGTIKIKQMTSEDVPLQKTLVVALFMPTLSCIEFDKMDIKFRLDEGKIFTDEIIAKGDTLSFNSNGLVQYDGFIKQDFEGILSSDFVEGLSRVVRNTLNQKEKDQYSFKCTIWGTFDNPKVELDKKLLKRAVKNVFQEVGRGFKSIFND